LVYWVLVLLLVCFNANAGVGISRCYDECATLFRDISFGSPLIGYIYVITPIGIALWKINKVAPKSKKLEENKKAAHLGQKLWVLAVLMLLFLLMLTI